MKKFFCEFINRLDMIEERISNLEDRLIQVFQNETEQKEWK